MGRPPTGHDPAFSLRLPPELIERIDQYAKLSGESRSEAMRALLEAGLAYKATMADRKPKPKQTATTLRRQRRQPRPA
jgi:metal-responsive CopG/Arc/MetJ family transcriptional regulator